jgi:putative DNA primase/helicase
VGGERPPLTIRGAHVPAELQAYPQWVCWRWEFREGKWTKPPVSPAGGAAKSTGPETWGTYEQAVAAAASLDGGIGFVLTKDDPFVGVDMDGCRDPATGVITLQAQVIIDALESYTEISPSGTGLRIIVRGTLPPGGRKRGWLEVYDHARYLTITGAHLDGTRVDVAERTEELASFHADHFPPATPTSEAVLVPVGGSPALRLELDDVSLLHRARASKNGDRFARFWSGSLSDTEGDHSSADLQLCGMLAFWTGKDIGRIDRLFRQSGLYRKKWDERHYSDGRTYGQATLGRAIAECKDVYDTPKSGTPDDPELDGPHETDTGNALRFVDQWHKEVRYCPPWKTWLLWDGKRWALDRQGEVMERAKKTVLAIYDEVALAETDTDKARIRKHAKASEASGQLQAMVGLARSVHGIPVMPEQLDADRWMLNVDNGTLDLRTGELLPHRIEHAITKLAPVAYDASAICPQWHAFLSRIMAGNEGLVTFLQRVVGYALTGSIREQCFFILWGDGANGKSAFLQILASILGPYADTAPFDTFMEQKFDKDANGLAALQGARFVWSAEGQSQRRLAEALVKQITGGEPIKTRFMYQEFFTYLPQFKLFLATNHRPVIKDTDEGIWRRVRPIPFTVTIPPEERDLDFATKIVAAEAPGILRWAVEGCLAWQREGLTAPAEVQAAARAYREEMDVVGGFLAERTDKDPIGRVTVKALYAAFVAWCQDSGEKTVSKKAFGQQISKHGYDDGRDMHSRFWIGVRLLGGGEEAHGVAPTREPGDESGF